MLSLSAILTLGVTLGAAVLIISRRLRADLVGLIVMVVIGLTGLVSTDKVFAGFSGSAVMTILGISMISEGLYQAGVTHWLGQIIGRLGGQSEARLILVIMLTSATVSLFMNNIAAVGVLLPAVMGVARIKKISPSRLLLPLAYGTILGGMATLLTTSNIIVSGTLRDAGYKPFGLLDFFPTGAPIVLLGTIYMVTFGRWLLPQTTSSPHSDEKRRLETKLSELYQMDEFLYELEVLPDSPLARLTIRDAGWTQKTGVTIARIMRAGQPFIQPNPDVVILPGDHLFVHGSPQADDLVANRLNLTAGQCSTAVLSEPGSTLAEVLLTHRSHLIGKTLCETRFREKYQVNVLAVWRESRPIHTNIGSLPLQFGDALLVQGNPDRIHLLQNEADMVLLEEDPDSVKKPQKKVLAAALMTITLGFAATGIMPVAQVVLAGAILLILTGCLSLDDAYRSIEWKAIFLIAGMWPLSTAIIETGLAETIVQETLKNFGGGSAIIAAVILISFAFLLTQIVSGQVASLVLAPLAISAARFVGADPRALAVAVALGCSLAFATPFGHPVNIMVMNPGGYKMKDYSRVGLPLTALTFLALLAGLHWFWGI